MSYIKHFGCSESFPVKFGDTWTVKQAGKVVERWEVIDTRKTSFTAKITELVPLD